MKVPVYTRQTAAPTQGIGIPFTQQLSIRNLTAPARAQAEAGLQLVETGKQVSRLANFVQKKAQIVADTEAQDVAINLKKDLNSLRADINQSTDIGKAEKNYREKSRLLVEKYKSGLSGTMARRAFSKRSKILLADNDIKFTKENNKRVVELQTVKLEKDLDEAVDIATDATASDTVRLAAASRGLDLIKEAAGLLGPKEIKKVGDKYYEKLARQRLTRLVDGGGDTETLVNDFRDGKSEDPLLQAVHKQLPRNVIDDVSVKVKQRSETIRTTREREDKVRRANEIVQFKEYLAEQKNKLEVGDMTSDEEAVKMTLDMSNTIDTFIQNHEGTEESKAQLRADLNKLRSETNLSVGKLRREAKINQAKDRINDDLKRLTASVTKNPDEFTSALEILEQVITDPARGLMSSQDIEELKEAGREELIISTLEGMNSRGNYDGYDKFLSQPGILASLTSSNQSKYTKISNDRKAEDNKFAREKTQRIQFAEEALGRPLTGEEKLAASGIKIGGNNSNFDDESKLRREFSQASKEYVSIRNAYQQVLANSETVSITNDVAIIFSFMKILDPGSVVREGEQATARNAANVPDRIIGLYNRLLGGGRGGLAPKQRANFVKSAKNLYEKAERRQRTREDRFRDLATLYKFNPELVVQTQILGFDEGQTDRRQTQAVSKREQTQDQTTSTSGMSTNVINLDALGNVVQ